MISNKKFKKLLKRYGIKTVFSQNNRDCGYIIDSYGNRMKVKDLLAIKDENGYKKTPNILK